MSSRIELSQRQQKNTILETILTFRGHKSQKDTRSSALSQPNVCQENRRLISEEMRFIRGLPPSYRNGLTDREKLCSWGQPMSLRPCSGYGQPFRAGILSIRPGFFPLPAAEEASEEYVAGYRCTCQRMIPTAAEKKNCSVLSSLEHLSMWMEAPKGSTGKRYGIRVPVSPPSWRP